MRGIFGAASLLLALQGTAALACGHCVEDKIATAYDHATVTRAHSAGHHVAFCAIEGRVAGHGGLRRDIERRLESIVGVDRGSAKVSLEDASLSFAFDPTRASWETVLRTAQRKLANKGITLVLLRVMEPPAELKASAQMR